MVDPEAIRNVINGAATRLCEAPSIKACMRTIIARCFQRFLTWPSRRTALVTMRYVRSWYADGSREVELFPRATWELLTAEQQSVLRFPIEV